MTLRPHSVIGDNVLEALVDTAKKTPPGCFVEVGVYRGGSAFRLMKAAVDQGRQLFAYDTFEGMPFSDIGDVHPVGDFNDTSYDGVKILLKDAVVVKGVFPESAVEMPPVAFAHIDCDQYKSIKESILYLRPLMVKGGVMWFDDYGYVPGATIAINELFPYMLEKSTQVGKAFLRIN